MDWRNKEIRHILLAEMLNPSDYTHLGWLPITGGLVTEKYYSDTRIQGTVETDEFDSYIDLSMIRLVHGVNFGTDIFRETLGTFFVEVSSDTYTHGMHKAKLNLNSVLWGMQDDPVPTETTLAEGGYTADAIQQICNACRRPYIFKDTANNSRFGSNYILEAFDSYLSHLFQIADVSNNYVDCDPDGNVTIDRYISPSERPPILDLYYGDTLIRNEPISYENGDADTYSRAIVTWQHQEEGASYDDVQVITGYADVEDGDRLSLARRGYRRGTVYREDDLGNSLVLAQSRAKEYLETDSMGIVTWEIQTKYLPLKAGDVIRWYPKDGIERVCMITSLERSLTGGFGLDIIMKEVA